MKNYELLEKSKIKTTINYLHEVSKVTIDSRKVKEGAVYLCEDLQYLEEAILKGAKTIITSYEIFNFNNHNVNIIKVNNLRSTYALLLKIFYENFKFPYLIGVTGTCGKTTVTTLLYRSLKLDHDVVLISSNGIYQSYQGKELYVSTTNTTPSLEVIYDSMFGNNYQYAIIEVSSQGIDNGRILGLEFDTAVFLNLSHEHLDHHLNLQNYFKSKLQLFSQLKADGFCIVNQNFEQYQEIFNNTNGKPILFNPQELQLISRNLKTQTIMINDEKVETIFNGDYNIENIMAVVTILKMLKQNVNNLIITLKSKAEIDGRLNILEEHNRIFVVDYAHTPVETFSLLSHLVKYKKKRLITVIGCGGNRDQSKRQIISNTCMKFSDFVIFTEDNNRNEPRIKIINDMLKGVHQNHYQVILNRVAAIKKAISISNDDDIVVLIGRGNEQYYDLFHQKVVTDMAVIKLFLEEEQANE